MKFHRISPLSLSILYVFSVLVKINKKITGFELTFYAPDKIKVPLFCLNSLKFLFGGDIRAYIFELGKFLRPKVRRKRGIPQKLTSQFTRKPTGTFP